MELQKSDVARARQIFQARLEKKYNEREARRRQALAAVEAVVAEVMARYPSVKTAYLFGSVTRPGSFHARSDVDIGVEGIAPPAYSSLWRDLEAALPHWFIDLRELPAGSPFAELVKLTGKRVYERKNISPASGDQGCLGKNL